jgi:enoyl-CoA hydratase
VTPTLGVARAGRVLTLTLDRPDQLNALTDELSDAFAHELERAASYDDVRVVVLRGAGRAFCAGADISAVDGPMQLDVRALDRANRIVRAITRLDKPVVAGVHGVAAGVGCSIALAADLCLAAESASFLLAFTRIGLMPDGGSTASVAASIGRARAMRMALLAEPLTGRLAAAPPLAMAATKRAVNAEAFGGLDEALERERTGQTMLLRTRDAAEGMRAFAERRHPDFEGE